MPSCQSRDLVVRRCLLKQMAFIFRRPVGQLTVDALFNATIQMLPFPIHANHQRGKKAVAESRARLGTRTSGGGPER